MEEDGKVRDEAAEVISDDDGGIHIGADNGDDADGHADISGILDKEDEKKQVSPSNSDDNLDEVSPALTDNPIGMKYRLKSIIPHRRKNNSEKDGFFKAKIRPILTSGAGIIAIIYFSLFGLLIFWLEINAEHTKERLSNMNAPLAQNDIPLRLVVSDISLPEEADNYFDGEWQHTPLLEAPFSGLTEETEFGLLPRISENGTLPRDAYIRPITPSTSNIEGEIAIIITDLGLSQSLLQQATTILPPDISLGFLAFAPNLQAQVNQARAAGHELILQIPMEPSSFEVNNPGRDPLLTLLPQEVNSDRLKNFLSNAQGYFAISSYMGGNYTSDPVAMETVMRIVSNRGLSWVDNGNNQRSVTPESALHFAVPFAAADYVIGESLNSRDIAYELETLERFAAANGSVIGIAEPTPLMLNMINEWARQLPQKNLRIVPVSAMMGQVDIMALR